MDLNEEARPFAGAAVQRALGLLLGFQVGSLASLVEPI